MHNYVAKYLRLDVLRRYEMMIWKLLARELLTN